MGIASDINLLDSRVTYLEALVGNLQTSVHQHEQQILQILADLQNHEVRLDALEIDMSSIGPNSPGTLADDAAVGTAAWSVPGNAASSNNSYAQAQSPFDLVTSHYLKATNFGFAVPDGATIVGVAAGIERRADLNDAGNNVKDVTVKLVKGGTVSGDNKAAAATNWPTSDTTATYGGESDLWGLTLAPADANANNFGLVLSANLLEGAAGINAFVDHITLTVYYTVAAGGVTSMTRSCINPAGIY